MLQTPHSADCPVRVRTSLSPRIRTPLHGDTASHSLPQHIWRSRVRGGSFTGETLDSGSGPVCDTFTGVVRSVLILSARDMDHCSYCAREGRDPNRKVWRLENFLSEPEEFLIK